MDGIGMDGIGMDGIGMDGIGMDGIGMDSADRWRADDAVTVAAFEDYPSAQRAIDFLAAQRFPTHRVTVAAYDVRRDAHAVARSGDWALVLRDALASAIGRAVRPGREPALGGGLVAARFGVRVPAEHADGARRLLAVFHSDDPGARDEGDGTRVPPPPLG